MPSEAQARITINKMLEDAGWRFLPDGDGKRENVILEHRLSGRTFSPNADLGKDFERAPEGFVDYVLLNSDVPRGSGGRGKARKHRSAHGKRTGARLCRESKSEPHFSKQRSCPLVLEFATGKSCKDFPIPSA